MPACGGRVRGRLKRPYPCTGADDTCSLPLCAAPNALQRLRSFFTIDKRLSHLLRKLEQLEQKTDHLISLKTDEVRPPRATARALRAALAKPDTLRSPMLASQRTMSVELLICGLIFTEIVLNVQLGAHNHPPLPPPV